MFASLVRQAQASVDDAIAIVVNRIVVAVPFLAAAGFAVSALSTWLSSRYGSQIADLILAFGFLGIGIVTAIVVELRQPSRTAGDIAPASTNAGEVEAESGDDSPPLAGMIDNGRALGLLASAAPMAIPVLLKHAIRNLPLILMIAVAAYVLTRQPDAATDGPGDPSARPLDGADPGSITT
jgi:hypothetical protein